MSNLVLAAPFIGELGHELMFWQALLRWMKLYQYKAKKMVVASLPGHEILYEFADELLLVPGEMLTEEIYHTQSTWESESNDSNSIMDWFNNIIDNEEMNCHKVIWPHVDGRIKYRHGYWDLINNKSGQLFSLLQASAKAVNEVNKKLSWDEYRWGKYIVIYPRFKPNNFAARNWDFWLELISRLRIDLPDLKLVVVGVEPLTQKELVEKVDHNFLLPANYPDLDIQVALLQNAAFSITSISGCTFLSLLSGCPTFVIGSKKCEHHLKFRNVFGTKTEYVCDRNPEYADQMPGKDMLEEVCSQVGVFGESCMDGRFSV